MPLSTIEESSFSLPSSGTGAYQAGDLIANAALAGSVVVPTLRVPQGGIWLRHVSILKSQANTSGASFRVWFSATEPTFAAGDNGVLNVVSGASIDNVQFPVDLSANYSLPGVGDYCDATFDHGLRYLTADSYTNQYGTIYWWLEARASYTPVDSEQFTLRIRGQAYY